MAIVLAIQKCRPYLEGCHFTVHTDQQSLKFLLEQRLIGRDHQKWIAKLMGYSFDIQYRPGAENKVADALSRVEYESSLAVLTTQYGLNFSTLQ